MWQDHLHRLSPAEFKLRYRLDLASFNHLHDLLEEELKTKNVKQAECGRPSGGAVDSRVRLAITLRYLAGGSIEDIRLIYHVSKMECYRCMWRTIDAINEHPDLQIEFPIDDPDALRDMESEFARAHFKRYGSFSWRGNVGAIDGIDFAMKNPGDICVCVCIPECMYNCICVYVSPTAHMSPNITGKAVDNPRRFYVTRKHGHELLCIAICDAQRRFTYYNIGFEPSSHDSLAWAGTKLGAKIDKEGLGGYFLNGDNAFTQQDHMLVPSGASDYDFYQSSNRMVIECAFGELIRRWGVFWRPLEVAYERRSPLIAAAMKLHNYCIDRKIMLNLDEENGYTLIQPRVWAPSPLMKDGELSIQMPGYTHQFLDTGARGSNSSSTRANAKRDEVAGALRDAGLVRPNESARRQALRGVV